MAWLGRDQPAARRAYIWSSVRRVAPWIIIAPSAFDIITKPHMSRTEQIFAFAVKPLAMALIAVPWFAWLRGRVWDRRHRTGG